MLSDHLAGFEAKIKEFVKQTVIWFTLKWVNATHVIIKNYYKYLDEPALNETMDVLAQVNKQLATQAKINQAKANLT